MTATRRIHLENILCPTDFSEFSARALRHAAALARNFDARLTVLHVVPFATAYGAALPYFPTLPLVATPELRKLASAQLREFVEPLNGDQIALNLEVHDGEPWREIRDTADLLSADLLVMGTHGRGGFEHFILGSVTEKVLRSVPYPIMTVCHEEGRTWAAPGLMSRILCATDLMATSGRTIRFALSLAAENQARVTLLHVVEPASTLAASEYAPHTVGNVQVSQGSVETAERLLKIAVPNDARTWCDITERIETGKARDKILEVAAEERSDLIIMDSRGHGPLGRLLYGSTSVDVIRAATCPVLVAKHPLRGAHEAGSPEQQRALVKIGA